MGKWLMTVLVPFVFIAVYVAALVYTFSHSVWGNLALAGLSVATIPVAYAVTCWMIDRSHEMSEARRGQWMARIGITGAILLVWHIFAAFMPTIELKLIMACVPLVIGVLVGPNRWLMVNKPQRTT